MLKKDIQSSGLRSPPIQDITDEEQRLKPKWKSQVLFLTCLTNSERELNKSLFQV